MQLLQPLKQLRVIWSSLIINTATILVHISEASRVDYCNTCSLQAVMNAAARLITGVAAITTSQQLCVMYCTSYQLSSKFSTRLLYRCTTAYTALHQSTWERESIKLHKPTMVRTLSAAHRCSRWPWSAPNPHTTAWTLELPFQGLQSGTLFLYMLKDTWLHYTNLSSI